MKILIAIVVIAIIADHTPIASAAVSIQGPIGGNGGSGGVVGIGLGLGVGGDAQGDGIGGHAAGVVIGGGLRPRPTFPTYPPS